jgi:2-phospho-L-lactate guanylyltransferase
MSDPPRVAALVPFKRFTRAKSRLRGRYRDQDVEALGRAMLADVLAALLAAKGIERVTVLTEDAEVAAAARQAGAQVRLREPDPGLNQAIEAAAKEHSGEGFDSVLVALGDLPLLQPADVERALELGRAHPVVLVPSLDGGTALLLRRPPHVIPARFGAGSAAAHEAEARARGIAPVRAATAREIGAIDLDTPEDAARVLASDVPCRTRELLQRLAR